MTVDTLGHLLALLVTPADQQERDQVEQLAEAVQEVTGKSVHLAFVDRGYTGEDAQKAAKKHGIELHVVKLPQAITDGYAVGSAALCYFPVAGLWNVPFLGQRGSVACPKTTSVCPKRWRGCTLPCSPC